MEKEAIGKVMVEAFANVRVASVLISSSTLEPVAGHEISVTPIHSVF